MIRFWLKLIFGLVLLGGFAFIAWIVVANVRYHLFPIPYQVIATGQLPYENLSINEARLWVVGSGSLETMALPSEITTIVNQVNFDEKIAIIIENQVHEPFLGTEAEIRRIIDITNGRIHIESQLYRSSNYETTPTHPTYDYIVLTFDKYDHWEDEMEFHLFNGEQIAAFARAKIR